MKDSAVLLFLANFLLLHTAAIPAYSQNDDQSVAALQNRLRDLSPLEQDEVIWFARCIYSESDKKNEQEMVAWVIRNRVDTKYRGKTYREVVLEPLQFSVFNTPSPRRAYILSLNQSSTHPAWLQALKIALDVFESDPINRPISENTRHFYSPISMPGQRVPGWAQQADPLDLDGLGIDPQRFLFFEEIDESADPFMALDLTPEKRINEFQDQARERLRPVSKRTSLRDRWKPSGRVHRPARPSSRKP